MVAGCGGGGGNSGGGTQPPPPTITSVSVSCAAPTVATGKTLQCTPTVTGTGNYSSAVTWAVNGTSGGSATYGSISVTGQYQAPTAAPAAYIVTLSATSSADPTKSGSASVSIEGVISSATQPIIASAGGTISLSGGGSVTIPANTLTADATATLQLSSAPTQPTNKLFSGSGPSLILSLSPAVGGASPALSHPSAMTTTTTTSGTSNIAFVIPAGQDLSATQLQNALGVADVNDGTDNFFAVPFTYDQATNQSTLYVDPSTLQPSTTLQVDLAIAQAHDQNHGTNPWLQEWDDSIPHFVDTPTGFCPSGSRTLVFVHGMLSSIQDSFGQTGGAASCALKNGSAACPISRGPYDTVLGINYDWWDDISTSAQSVAGYINSFFQSPCYYQGTIDLEAHSEGTVVTLASSGLLSPAATAHLGHVVLVAGPIEGTPVAQNAYDYLTFFLNLTPAFPATILMPPKLSDADGFIGQLATGSETVNAAQLAAAKTLTSTEMIVVGGSNTIPTWWDHVIQSFMGGEPNDGIIPVTSALPADSVLPNLVRLVGDSSSAQQHYPFPYDHVDLVDNQNVMPAIFGALSGGGATKNVTLSVMPGSLSLPVGQTWTLSANYTGILNPFIQWTVDHGSADGTVTPANGMSTTYTAPQGTGGPFNARATMPAIFQGTSTLALTSASSITVTASSDNPVPTISSLAPPSLPTGSSQQTLTIIGSGFLTASTVALNGIAHVAAFVNGNQLTISLASSDLAAAGTYPVVVTNPAPGGGSATSTFTVTAASIVAISPRSAVLAEAGTEQFTATVAGGGTVNWSVQEGATGGTITSAGLYTAPATTGTYHVIATDSADSSQTATATVTVVSPGTIAFQWIHSWGGSADDFGNSVGTDPSGNVYVAGSTKSFGAGGQDVLVVKYDPSGNVLWAKTWGGASDDVALGMLVDAQGNSYVVGYTASFGAGGNDVLLLKFDTNGNLIWSRTWGGFGFDVGYDIALDQSGNLNIAAESYSFGEAAVLLKVAPDGTLLGSYTWKGPATYDSGYSLTTDANGNTILVGTSWDYSVSPNHNTIFILKYDSQGNLIWNRTWAGPSEDEITGRKTVRTDANGNIYVVGQTSQSCTTSDFSQCDFDVLLLQIDPNGNLVNASRWGGTGLDAGNSIWLNSANELTVVGSTTSFFGGLESALIQQYDANGNILASQVYNSAAASGWNGIFANPSGGFVATGFGQSSTGAWQDTGIASVPAAGSLATPSGTAASVSGSWSAPSGNISDAVGVIDIGGGGNDVLTATFTTGTSH